MSAVSAPESTWDLTPLFPGVASPEFETALAAFAKDAAALGERAGALSGVGGAGAASEFEAFLTELNRTVEAGRLLSSYVGCLTTTDSFAAAPQRAASQVGKAYAELSAARASFAAWIGTLDVEALLAASELAREHEFAVRRASIQASHQMGAEAEALAAELELTGRDAWDKLYGNLTSQIEVSIGDEPPLPMSAVRSRATDADRRVRRAAHEAELAAWDRHAMPIASALNAIKGASLALAKRRKWASPLDEALLSASIDHEVLDAMLGAAEASFPQFRRYLRAKAKALGIPRLAFYDLFAPLPGDAGEWSYERGCAFVLEHFYGYSDDLGDLARRAIDERWMDVESRAGKVGGAYCTSARRGESRVLLNHRPSYGGVSTIAHELGHAYHNHCLRDRTSVQRSTPMTLAETASTFCETVISRAALDQATPDQELAILEARLQGATQVVVDISSRFRFERAVFERLAVAELSAQEFTDLMLQAQRETYGDGLDPDALHGAMWAAKPHYYGSSYYNFPYMFGLLFGLGLYAEYVRRPEGFQARYARLLSRTGMAGAEELAAEFDIDLRSGEFWQRGLSQIGSDIERFCSLVGA